MAKTKPAPRKHITLTTAAAILLSLALITIALPAGAAPPAAAKTTLRFGINPWASEEQMHKTFRPLINYLSEKLGIKIDIIIPSSYEELSKRMAAGEIDLASFNSVTLLKARRNGLPIQYLVTTTNKFVGTGENRDYYEGFIIVKKNSPYKTLDDLSGKTFAFVDTDSASGYKMPVALLAFEKNVSPKQFFKKYFFAGDHDRVAAAVYYGSVDGGATWDTSYAQNTAKDKFPDAFRIIERISPIPNDAWVVGPTVKPEMAEKIKAVLLTINETTVGSDGKLVLDPKLDFPGTGWSERSMQFYEDKAKYLLFNPK